MKIGLNLSGSPGPGTILKNGKSKIQINKIEKGIVTFHFLNSLVKKKRTMDLETFERTINNGKWEMVQE